MAYVAYGHSGGSRAGTIATVIAVHAGLGALLLYGLSVNVIPLPEDGPFVAFTRSDEKVKPPDPKPVPPPTKEQAAPSSYTPPTSFTLKTEPAPIRDLPLDLDATVFPLPDSKLILEPMPPMPPASKFSPKSASPRGDRSAWVTTNDYPSRDIREGNTGKVLYEVSIDLNGRVTDCRITGSSGHPGLDKATCDKVSKRARFDPATDGNGAKVEGTYSGSVLWRIPE